MGELLGAAGTTQVPCGYGSICEGHGIGVTAGLGTYQFFAPTCASAARTMRDVEAAGRTLPVYFYLPWSPISVVATVPDRVGGDSGTVFLRVIYLGRGDGDYSG